MLTRTFSFRLLPLAAMALAAVACTTDNERSDLVITKAVRPTIVSSSGGSASCEVNTGTSEATFGGLDPTLATSYTMGLVMENRLSTNANPVVGRLNTNDFQAEQTRVDYEFPDPAFQGSVGEHVTPANGLVPTGSSAAIGTVLIPADVIATLKNSTSGGNVGTLRIKARVEGKLLDGSSVKTSQFEYTIRVCTGCGPALPTCTAPAKAFICAPGQDSDAVCQ
jgi:hypothetical protein